jgi:exoribonuclease R
MFSAVFKLDRKGKVLEEWFGKTVNSDHRVFHEEAQKTIEGDSSFMTTNIREPSSAIRN